MNDRLPDAEGVILFSLLIAPVVMAAAISVERRLGPSAAGWVAALPVSFAVAAVTVTLDAGTGTASTMALSAATHVPAQVMFAIVFAAVLTRRGLGLGNGRRGLRLCRRLDRPWRCTSRGRRGFRDPFASARAAFDAQRPATLGSPRCWQTTALTCASASFIVGATVVTSRLAGPEAAGAVLAVPTMSALLAITVVIRDGPLAGAHALAGLVRSLPCYLAFGLVVIVAAPSVGLAAIALGLVACLGAAPGNLARRARRRAARAGAVNDVPSGNDRGRRRALATCWKSGAGASIHGELSGFARTLAGRPCAGLPGRRAGWERLISGADPRRRRVTDRCRRFRVAGATSPLAPAGRVRGPGYRRVAVDVATRGSPLRVDLRPGG